MKPKHSQKELTRRLTAGRKELANVTPAEGIAAMLAFYAEQRAAGCDVAEDDDMLLYQWGTYDWGQGETLQLNVTRQFILPRQDEPYQLSLTFHFDASPALRETGSGSERCSAPADLPAFRDFITASPAYRAVVDRAAQRVELSCERC